MNEKEKETKGNTAIIISTILFGIIFVIIIGLPFLQDLQAQQEQANLDNYYEERIARITCAGLTDEAWTRCMESRGYPQGKSTGIDLNFCIGLLIISMTGVVILKRRIILN